MREVGLGVVLAWAAIGCSAPPSPADAAADAAADTGIEARDAGPIATPAEPPRLACPPGWREVAAGGVTTCDPFPEGGARTDCAPDAAHFPGEPGCARIGTACPADGWPEGLPSAPTIFVRAGSAPGGDGSTREAALATVADALARAAPGAIVAVASGTYDGAIVIPAGVTVWGACVAGTRLTSSVPDEIAGVVDASGPGTAIRNLAIGDAPRSGVFLQTPGAELRVDDVLIERVETLGLASDDGRIEGRSVIVRDVAARSSDGRLGRGISGGAAVMVLERVVVERTRSAAIFSLVAPASVTVRDAVVRDSLERPIGLLGRGAAAQDQGRLELERVVLERSREIGVYSVHEGTTVVLRDVVVRDTLGRDSDGGSGIGVQAELGARIEAERLLVERSRADGLIASNAGSAIVASDVVVRDVEAEVSIGEHGFGVAVLDGASVSLTRAHVARAREVGVGLDGAGSSATLEDVVVAETRSRERDGRFGMGMWAQHGASIEARRIRLEGSRMVGVGAVDGASATIEDAEIRGTLPAACDAACAEEAAGIGVVAHYLSGRVRLTRFVIEGAALCGVAVGRDPDTPGDPGGELDLAEGWIGGAPIGACVQVDGYDTARLQRDVRYEDVGVPLQATSYPLPADAIAP